MAGRMYRSLTILLLAAGLGACATERAAPPERPTTGWVIYSPASPPDDPNASPYGLFLAGEVARDAGHLGAADFYLGRAAAAEGEPAFLKADAFTAALQAGDIEAAATLVPDAADPGDQHLGVLVRGVEAMAQDHDKEAYALFTGPDIDFPPKTAALLLAPFAAAGAGDAAHALASPDFDGDNVSQFVAALDHAVLLERYGKLPQAESLFKAMIAGGDDSGLVTSAYGDFLERHGRWADATALFRTRLARNPEDGAAAAGLARAQKHARPQPQPSVRQGAAGA